jgi:hypothetical protein
MAKVTIQPSAAIHLFLCLCADFNTSIFLAEHRLAGTLPWTLLGLRTDPIDDLDISSAEMRVGSPLTLPSEFLDSPEPPPVQFLQQA